MIECLMGTGWGGGGDGRRADAILARYFPTILREQDLLHDAAHRARLLEAVSDQAGTWHPPYPRASWRT
jgi:hypothetical protein